MATTITDATDAERYELREDGELVSVLDYRRSDGMLVIAHVETAPAHGGRGHAGRLTAHVIEQARQAGTPVLPVCGYARRWMLEHPDTLGLVPAARRAQLGLPAA